MANQRKRISELPPLDVASLDTTFVLGISGSTTYKISINNLTSSLDGAFATDLVTNALSSSLNSKLSTSSFNQYTASFTASVANGTISGSSQLTSSFDERYVVSGSITQTTWDNIANKPNDIVSSSTQISDLGFVTGSYTTITSFNSLTQSFNSISQSFNVISGSVVSIQGGFDTGSYQTFTSSVNTSISNLNTFTASQSTSSLVDRLNAIESVSGSWITESETGSFLTSLSGAISSSSQLTSSYDTRYTLSGSVQPLPSNLLSSSAQITAFGFISSSTTINTSSFATTGSNSFSGSQTITGSLIVSSVAVVNGAITIPTGSTITLTSGSNLYVQNNGLVEITGSLTATSITGSIAATNGVISGSSQLSTTFPSKTTGSWSVPTGASTRSFTVDWNHSYQMWVIGNIPNGIISWNATVNVTNSNVPIVGSQYGWYYAEGGALVLTDIPEQIVGVNGDISTTSFATTTSNTFEFGITNNSGTTQTINYGYIKLS
jgi:hypothetical protein